MVVVYTMSEGSPWQDNELRYSIRSFVKHSAVSRIIIVGYKPDWLINVEHISLEDGPRKQLNIHLKTLAACGVCDEFIQAADDHFLLADQTFTTYFYSGMLRDKKYENKYQIPVDNTLRELPNAKFFNLHIPMKMNSEFYKQTMANYDWDKKDYLIKTLYANHIDYLPIANTNDVKVSRFMRRDAIDKFIDGKGFLSVSDAGLSVDMKRFIEQRYPVKSYYEK